jgi:hypothetical protein
MGLSSILFETDVGPSMVDSILSTPGAVLIPSTKKGIDSVYSSVIFLQIKFPAVNTSPDKPDRIATKAPTIPVYDNLTSCLGTLVAKIFC